MHDADDEREQALDRRVRFERAPFALWRHVGDGLVLTTLDRETFEGTSVQGAAIWARLDRPRTLTELCGEVAPMFGATERAIRADVRALLHEMEDHGLVRRHDDD